MAAVPPELAAEVQKLERYHAENPQGRYFVPLANAYRKMGAIDQAEGLLREGLRRHPDYLSAHIVLGRCLADRGARDEAVGEFRYVLSVDPQNLIALRSLGEMASEGGRTDEAARWYRELLAVDPMNEDARQALEALEAGPASAQTWHEEEPAGGGYVDDDAPGAELPGAAAPSGVPEADEATSWGSLELDSARSGDAPVEEPSSVEPFDSLAFGDLELADAGTAAGSAEETEPGWGDGDSAGWDPYAGSTVDLETPGSAGGEEAGAGADGDGDGEEVVTETIAELYARQGFHDRAADVYRELIRRRGGDPALEARLREEERLAAGEPADLAAGPATDTDDLPLLEWSVGGTEPSAAEPEPFAAAGGAVDPVARSLEGGFGEPAPSAAEPETEPVPWEAASEADEVAAIFASDEAFFAAPADDFATAGRPVEDYLGTEPSYGEPAVEEPAVEEPAVPAPAAPAAGEGAPPAPGLRTARDYLAGIAAWRPAAEHAAPAAAAPAAPEPVTPAEPGASAAAFEAPAAREAAPVAEPPAPAGAADEDDDDMPWLAAPVSAEPGAPAEPEPLEIDGLLDAESAGAAASAGADDDDEPYPWEVAPAASTPAAAPPQEPEARPASAFSFEEFFVEAAETPAPPPPPEPEPRAAEPAPAQEPPAQPAADAGGDDEDLESFQAWLQSLKR